MIRKLLSTLNGFKILRRSKYFHIVHVDVHSHVESKIKYEDTLGNKLWRTYGKLLWQPLKHIAMRSINTWSYFTYCRGFRRKFLPHFKKDELDCKWVFMEKIYFDMPPNIIYVLLGYLLYHMKSFYLKHSYKIHNNHYRRKFCWYRPLLYVAYCINWLYQSDYTCCGYERHLSMDEEDCRYEEVENGADSTMDGTDYWTYGFIHCRRCNTPVWFHENSL